MSTKRCPTCNAAVYEWRDHRCPPKWRVGIEGYHGEDVDEFGTVYAYTPEGAAEKEVDSYDCSGDYTVVGGSPVNVTVIGIDGRRYRYEVTGEAVPSYSARLLT
jgi:hypothetical protein